MSYTLMVPLLALAACAPAPASERQLLLGDPEATVDAVTWGGAQGGASPLVVVNFGGRVLAPGDSVEITAASAFVSVPGTDGSGTDWRLRASDAANACDCLFACSLRAGIWRSECKGSCRFISASITYEVQSIPCATSPAVRTLAFYGVLQR